MQTVFMIVRVLVPCLLLAALTAAARAAVLHVPGDAPTIQAAIALAQPGDTILVAPGTWVGALDTLGKGVRIASEQGFATTAIDGGAARHAVVLTAGAGRAALEGFTVVGGAEARVLLESGDAVVVRCRIGGGPGRGVVAHGFGAVHTIRDCIVRGNAGGGLWLVNAPSFPDAVVERCLVEGNGSPDVERGGGILGSHSGRLLDCVVAGNTAQLGGGAADLAAFDGSLFIGNHATESGGAYWTYAWVDVAPAPLIANAAFVGNDAPDVGGVSIPDPDFAFSPPVTVRGCVFAGNQDDGGGIGLFARLNIAGGAVLTVDRCTFVGDRLDGGVIAEVSHSIFRGDAPIVAASGLTVSWCDVEGGFSGEGNFDADPLFVDAPHEVFALLPGSPCIDAGDPLGSPDPDGSRADVGAFPLAPFADARGSHFGLHGFPRLSLHGDLAPGSRVALSLVRARPAASAILVAGAAALHGAFKGGVLVPAPELVIAGLPVGGGGTLDAAAPWPVGVPPGVAGWVQLWIADAAATAGFSASNGVGLVAP